MARGGHTGGDHFSPAVDPPLVHRDRSFSTGAVRQLLIATASKDCIPGAVRAIGSALRAGTMLNRTLHISCEGRAEARAVLPIETAPENGPCSSAAKSRAPVPTRRGSPSP